MSLSLKYRMCQVLVAITIPLTLYVYSHMIPAGLSGDTAAVKKWFVASAVTVIMGCGAFIAARVYKLRLESHSDTNGMGILSAAATEISRTKESVRTNDHTKLDKPS